MSNDDRFTSVSAGDASRDQSNYGSAAAINRRLQPMKQATMPIRQFLSLSRLPSNTAALGAVSSAASQCIRAGFGFLGFGSQAYQMLMAGYNAMTIPRQQVSLIASAHTYGYWLFQHRNPVAPNCRPYTMRVHHRREDEIGNYDVLTTQQFGEIWQHSHYETLRALDRHFASVQIAHVTSQLLFFAERLDTQRMTDAEQRKLLKIFTAWGYDHDPEVAAAAYLLWKIADKSQIERQALAIMYRQYPYQMRTSD